MESINLQTSTKKIVITFELHTHFLNINLLGEMMVHKAFVWKNTVNSLNVNNFAPKCQITWNIVGNNNMKCIEHMYHKLKH